MSYVYDEKLSPQENELLEILTPYKKINYEDLVEGKEYLYFSTRSGLIQCALYGGVLQSKIPAQGKVSAKAVFENPVCLDPGLSSENNVTVPKQLPTIASKKTTIFYEEQGQEAGKNNKRGKKSKRRKNKKQKTKRTKRRR